MSIGKRSSMIYFDNAATTHIFPEALTSYVQVSERFWGNPSSLHDLGEQASRVLQKAREQVSELLGVNAGTIFFTSGGTESNNWAIKGSAMEKRVFGKHLITSKVEHPSVLNTMKQLESFGFEVSYVDVDSNGCVNVEQLVSLVRKDTILVSIMAVNNEVGAVQPIQEIAEQLEVYPWVHFHVDCVQGIDRVRDLLNLNRIDLLSLSAHKFHGPRGVGILYKKHGRKIQPLLTGGGQEHNERSTTENLPGIVATAKAMRMTMEEDNQTESLRQKLWDYLDEKSNITIFSPKNGASHIVCFAMHGVRGEVFVHALEEFGIYSSTTSACSSKRGDHSSTLHAMDVPEQLATSAVRISFSNENTVEEVDSLIEAIEQLSEKFQFLSRKK